MFGKQEQHPHAKEWQRLQRQEARLLRARRAEGVNVAERFLEEKIPDKLEATLHSAFAKAFVLVFSKGNVIITRSVPKGKREQEFKARAETFSEDESRKAIRSFGDSARISSGGHALFAGVEGVGLGLLGIGLPDIPIFCGVLLRSVYEIAARFGFSYESEEERDFILALIAAALSRGEAFETADRELNSWIDWGKAPLGEREVRIDRAAGALSGYLLYAKFVQGIPLVGALGGLSDSVCLARVTKYAMMKYQRRFLRQGGPPLSP